MELTENLSTFKLLVGALLTICLLKGLQLLYWHMYYWKHKKVPYDSGIPILGTGWRIFFRKITIVNYANYLYTHKPDCRYFGIMDFTTPALVVRDPELIKDITVKSFDNFPNHRSFVDEDIDPIFGKNVFSLRDERWKEMRNTLSPSFTASKMRFMFELVHKCSSEFVDYLIQHPDYCKSVEGKDLFTRYTTDVIATAAFGISVNSLKDRDNEFFVRGTDVSNFMGFRRLLKFIMLRLYPRFCRLLGITFLTKESTAFFKSIVKETIEKRDQENIVRPDMIHLLMQARDKTNGHEMTTDDIVAQAFIFFLAGFDTSSTLMCHLFHELTVCQDIQDKVREEVEQCIADGNGEITYESLAKMEYMEMVISEALRKYPALIFLDRSCSKPYELPPPAPGMNSVIVEPDTSIWFPVYSMHHDPKYFPDPQKFDPERFSEENKDSIVPYSYIPFGVGPRKCIGNRFALMETKLLVAHLLLKFKLKPTEKTQNPLVFSTTSFQLRSEGGYWMELEKRNV